jgi:hypothetical protein
MYSYSDRSSTGGIERVVLVKNLKEVKKTGKILKMAKVLTYLTISFINSAESTLHALY